MTGIGDGVRLNILTIRDYGRETGFGDVVQLNPAYSHFSEITNDEVPDGERNPNDEIPNDERNPNDE